MSIEQKIEDLTAAIVALTEVVRAKDFGTSTVITPEPKTRKSRKSAADVAAYAAARYAAAAEEPAVEEPAVEEPAVEEPAVEEPAVEEPVVYKEYALADIQKALMLIASRSPQDKAAVKQAIQGCGAATTRELDPKVYPKLVKAIAALDINAYTEVFGGE